MCTHFPAIFDWSFSVGVANLQYMGGAWGSGMVPSKRALVNSCRPSIVTFLNFTRFRDIATFVLHCGHYNLRSFKVIYFDVTEKPI